MVQNKHTYILSVLLKYALQTLYVLYSYIVTVLKVSQLSLCVSLPDLLEKTSAHKFFYSPK